MQARVSHPSLQRADMFVPSKLKGSICMECLQYAAQKYKEITGKPSPSSGWTPGEFWDNASDRQTGIRVPSIAIWTNGPNAQTGHALCIASYEVDSKTYEIYEANWDFKGNTRHIYRENVKGMYPSLTWKGTVYN